MKRFTRVVRVAETGSTNDDVAALLGEDSARGLVLAADYQTSGSGRRGRAWVAPPGSALLCTLALPEPQPAQNLWAIPFWAALITKAAIESLGSACTLQWPNDVLIAERKVAGILCISRICGEDAWAGCGVGINVLRPTDEQIFASLESPPAFLSDARDVSVDETLGALIDAAEAHYDMLERPDAIASAWERAAALPRRYRILKDGETQAFDATALRLDSNGALIVWRDGNEQVISLADARVLR